jgi:hypothetical protein
MNQDLDPATREKLADWINKHCPDLRCPACGKQEWSGGALAASVMVPTPVQGPIEFPRPPKTFQTLPLVYVFCGECGHAVTFSAVKVGILTT